MNTIDRLPPHNLEAEQAVLGCILMDYLNTWPDVGRYLRLGAASFYDLRHQVIFSAMASLSGKPIDTISVGSVLKQQGRLEEVGGLAYLSTLPDAAPSAAAFEFYAEQVSEAANARTLIREASEIVGNLYTGEMATTAAVTRLEKALFQLREHLAAEAPTLEPKELSQNLIDYLDYRSQLAGKRSGLETGFWRLDQLTDGLQAGEQFILAARPSVGKTAFVLNVVQRVCLMGGAPTLFISLEMSAMALVARLLASSSDVGLSSIKTGQFLESEFKSLNSFAHRLRHSNLYIVQGLHGLHTDQVASIIRREHAKHKFKLVVTDYLQKIRPTVKHEKRTYEVGETSGMLKALAVDTGAAFLTVAQLNRDPDKDKPRMPRMSDLADSGQIERDADAIGLLHRTNEKAGLLLAKQRDGETGMMELYFNGAHCRFENPKGNDEP